MQTAMNFKREKITVKVKAKEDKNDKDCY